MHYLLMSLACFQNLHSDKHTLLISRVEENVVVKMWYLYQNSHLGISNLILQGLQCTIVIAMHEKRIDKFYDKLLEVYISKISLLIQGRC